jgi:hypothetical protein
MNACYGCGRGPERCHWSSSPSRRPGSTAGAVERECAELASQARGHRALREFATRTHVHCPRRDAITGQVEPGYTDD